MRTVIVPPKVVHMRNEHREGAPPICGVRLPIRVPDYHRVSNPQEVTCKRCLRYLVR